MYRRGALGFLQLADMLALSGESSGNKPGVINIRFGSYAAVSGL